MLFRSKLVRVEGATMVLPPFAQVKVEAGDLLLLETPGGGGYGSLKRNG